MVAHGLAARDDVHQRRLARAADEPMRAVSEPGLEKPLMPFSRVLGDLALAALPTSTQ